MKKSVTITFSPKEMEMLITAVTLRRQAAEENDDAHSRHWATRWHWLEKKLIVDLELAEKRK